MSTKWLITIKPSFQTEWLVLPPKEAHQVLEKITLLTQDPTPDAKVKKQLKYMHGKLYRIRSGDYRIFYTFEQPYVSLLALRRRSDETYDEGLDVEFLGGFEPELGGGARASQPDWDRILAPHKQDKRVLPEPITKELLINLLVPEEYHIQLLSIQTQEDLLDCPDVPDEILLKIDESIFERPITQVIQQPDYLIQEVDDLLRFKEGKLIEFLLKLSPEQERLANWSMNITGPTQVKGNPGTGKSTVALYRIHSFIQRFRETGISAPLILYVTYTNALVKASKQLLQQLLGSDIRYVRVTTADKIVWKIVYSVDKNVRIAEDSTLDWLIQNITDQIQSNGNMQLQKALERLDHEYLLEEINQFIVTRQIKSLEEYLKTDRRGRKVRLSNIQQEAIWQVYELLLQQLRDKRQLSWQQVRLKAESLFYKDQDIPIYDAVVVDEAQDLDPSVLRLLFGLCKASNRFFITADANQSIYRSGFTWTDVHESLKFQGRRTTLLKTNYRSTRQISDAAQSYLAHGALETETIESVHLYNGPIPWICSIRSTSEEIGLLSSFLPGAAHECHLLLSSCAVLSPTKQAGIEIADELSKQGIRACFMRRDQVDLEFSGVKVLTLHSSKGIEFPIVALAGFINSCYANVGKDDLNEKLNRYRRLIFVGMTRAMRALLIIVPARTS